MPRKILDPKLLAKIATARSKSPKYVAETVSKLARKHGVSSEAALIFLAKQSSIGTAVYQRKLEPSKQTEVRDLLAKRAPESVEKAQTTKRRSARSKPPSKRVSLMRASKLLLKDQSLRERCLDLLAASSRYDRAINQATLVLEDRIRRKANPLTTMTGEPLVNFAFKDEIAKTILRVESGQGDDQRGFTQIIRGIFDAAGVQSIRANEAFF